MISLHRRVDFHKNTSTADSAVASEKYGIWSVPTAESAVPFLALPNRRSLLEKLILCFIHRRLGSSHDFTTTKSTFTFGTLMLSRLDFLLFYLTWLDTIDGLIRSLSPINMISRKNPQKRLKNTMIHLFTHKLAMK